MNKQKIMHAMPTILFVGSCVMTVGAVVCSGRDTLKAEQIVKKHHIYKQDEEHVDGLPTKEYVPTLIKETWKCYIPTVICTAAALGFGVASHRLTAKQIAGLSAAVASAGGLVTQYRDKIRDYASPEILEQIDKEIAAEEITKAKPPVITTSGLLSSEEMDLSSDDEILAFDPFTKVKFRTTKLALIGARYYLNRNFALGGNVPLSMFYAFLGLELPEEYNYCEWDCQLMCDDGYYWIDIDFTKSDEPDPETGERYYIIEYGFDPGETEDSYYIYGPCR